MLSCRQRLSGTFQDYQLRFEQRVQSYMANITHSGIKKALRHGFRYNILEVTKSQYKMVHV